MRQELLDAGYSEDDVLDMPLEEIRNKAEEEANYTPVIEITHNWPGSDRPALVIKDNGIGISVEEFLVMKKHAHSTSFLDGSVGGQFGQGIYSVFMLVGPNGEGKFETKSRIDDASYGMRMRITGFNRMPGDRESYGTTFTFPALSEEGQDVDIGQKIDEYCQGIRVPVTYEEFDANGQHVFQDDWVPMKLEEDYDETSPLVTYETKYFRAVASPDTTSGNRTPKTLLTSMPIERNDSRYSGTSNDKFESPWKFDIRLNYEDGRIVFGPNKGLVPVDEKSYEKMTDERKEHYIPRPEMDPDDIEMPKPVDDRDRLRDGHRDFFQKVSRGLSKTFGDKYAEILSDVDEFEDIVDMSPRDRTLFLRGYSHFGPKTKRSDPENVQETLEDKVGVTVPVDVCKKLSMMKRSVLVVPRGTSNPSRKGGRSQKNREKKKVWRIIAATEPDGEVYMGKTIGEKKCRLAWELHDDNVVVQLDGDTVLNSYGTGEDTFGWKKLKDLPSRNLGEKFPQLSQDFLDNWDNASSSTAQSSGSGRGSYDRARAKKRSIKVRTGTGQNQYRSYKAQKVYERLDNGKSVKAKGYSGRRSQLIVVDQNDHGVGEFSGLARNNVGYTVVPTYVKKYLLEADNTYTPEQIKRHHCKKEIEFDWTAAEADYDWNQRDSAPIGELTKNDVILTVEREHVAYFKEHQETIRDVVQRYMKENGAISATEMRTFTIMADKGLNSNWMAFRRHASDSWTTEATVFTTSTRGMNRVLSRYSTSLPQNDTELYLELELPSDQYPRETDEWNRLFGDGRRAPISVGEEDELITMVQDLASCDGVEHPFPSQRGDDNDDG